MTLLATSQKPPHHQAAIAPASRWTRAYRTAMLNALLYLVLATFNWAMGIEQLQVHIGVAIIFFLGSLYSFVRLMRAGGELAAVTFFVLGAGLFFGFGAAFAGIAPDRELIRFFGSDLLPSSFANIHLMNAGSVVIVLAAAWPFCRAGPRAIDVSAAIQDTIRQVMPLRHYLFALSFAVFLLLLVTFPSPHNLILRSLVNHLAAIGYVTLLMAGTQWSKTGPGTRVTALVLLGAMTFLGLLTLAKVTLLTPIVAFAVGLMLDRGSRGFLVALMAATAIAYFGMVAELCNAGRNHPIYNNRNTPAERVTVVSDTALKIIQNRVDDRGRSPTLLRRFSATQIQGYLMEQYDFGSPGISMNDAWQGVVPRFLWRNKPNITRFGRQLDALAFRRERGVSQLAPTYSAEAYWNGGWIEVIIASLIIGLEIGWFTHKWNLFTREGIRHLGILALAIPVLIDAAWVESWFVAAHVGGFFTLLVLMKIADVAGTLMLAPRSTSHIAPRVLSTVSRAAP